MKIFKHLSGREKRTLLEFPAYISLLAANADGKLDETERIAAIDFEHIKTYSGDAKLADFYHEVDKTFEATLEELDKALPLNSLGRSIAIKNKLAELEKILLKLGPEYGAIMHRSMESFKEHVSNAHHNVLVDFIFPVPIKGLSY